MSDCFAIDVHITSSEGPAHDLLIFDPDRRQRSEICPEVGHVHLQHYVALLQHRSVDSDSGSDSPSPASSAAAAAAASADKHPPPPRRTVIDLCDSSTDDPEDDRGQQLQLHIMPVDAANAENSPGEGAADSDPEDLRSSHQFQPQAPRPREWERGMAETKVSPNKIPKKRQRLRFESTGPGTASMPFRPDDDLYNQTPSPAASVATSTTTTVTEVQHAGHTVSTGLSTGISKLKIEQRDQSDSEMTMHVVPRPASESVTETAAPVVPLPVAVAAQPTKNIVRRARRLSFKLKRKPVQQLPAEDPSAASTPDVPVSGTGASVNTASSAPAPRNVPRNASGLPSGPVSAPSQHPGSPSGTPRRDLITAFNSTLSVSSSTRNSSHGANLTYAGYGDTEGFHFGDTDVDTDLKLVLQATNW